MKTQKRFPQVLALIVLLTLGAVWVPARSSEQPIPADARKVSRLVTGLLGLAAGQTARMSVVNWGDQPVKIEMLLLDENGKADIVCNGIVAPGQTLSDEFPWPCCGGRVEVRAMARPVDPQERKAFEQLVGTLEIIDDQTGKTTGLLPYISLPPVP